MALCQLVECARVYHIVLFKVLPKLGVPGWGSRNKDYSVMGSPYSRSGYIAG